MNNRTISGTYERCAIGYNSRMHGVFAPSPLFPAAPGLASRQPPAPPVFAPATRARGGQNARAPLPPRGLPAHPEVDFQKKPNFSAWLLLGPGWGIAAIGLGFGFWGGW